MTLRKIKIISFVFYIVYGIIAMLLIAILFQGKNITDFGWTQIVPGLLIAALFVLVVDYPKKYNLDLKQEKQVREHLHSLGYQLTTDEGNNKFFRRRKYITWHTAKLERGEKYLVLRSSENHGKYFKKS